MRPWLEKPNEWDRKILCESCLIELGDFFIKCPKCGSTARHLEKYYKKNADTKED